jgi:hypothetical protein
VRLKHAWLYVAALWMVCTGVFGPAAVAACKGVEHLPTAATLLIAVFGAWLMGWVWVAVLAMDGRDR